MHLMSWRMEGDHAATDTALEVIDAATARNATDLTTLPTAARRPHLHCPHCRNHHSHPGHRRMAPTSIHGTALTELTALASSL